MKTFKVVILLILCALMCLPAANSSAESLYIRKIVSIVYDDSGSMSSNGQKNWAYANYAVQAFSGLLNSEDQLFITYMSEPTRSVRVDLAEPQKAIDEIRSHSVSGDTPLSSIATAFDKLRSVSDGNINTQYWLVVITDGEFQGGANGNATQEELNEKLRGYAATVMPNGTTPQITYLGIGDKVISPDADTGMGIYVYPENSAESIIAGGEIVSVMSKIADKVSGRSRLSSGDITLVNGKTVQVRSSIPLLNIAVLAQNSSATLKSVSVTGGGSLTVERSGMLRYPERNGWVTDTSLRGGAFLISGAQGNIEAGSYLLEFSEAVDKGSLVVMLEPALELRIILTAKGTNVADVGSLRAGDAIAASCGLYEIGTDREISPSLLPANTEYALSVYESGALSRQNTDAQMMIDAYTLSAADTKIAASVTIRGFTPMEKVVQFTPPRAIAYSLDIAAPEEMSFTIAELRNNEKKILFTVFADGVPVTKAEAEALDFRIDSILPGILHVEDDGSISFTPSYQGALATASTGNIDVTGILNNTISKGATVYVKPAVYHMEAFTPDENTIVRTNIRDNTISVRFEAYADGEKLDKASIEALGLTCALDEAYTKMLDLNVEVQPDGTIVCTPKRDIMSFIATWVIPCGDVTVTATSSEGMRASGVLKLVQEPIAKTILHYVLPFLMLALLAGILCKKRFSYFAKIHYNHAAAAGSTITGPRNGWNSKGLFTPWMLVPFFPDKKEVNGVKFYAQGPMWRARAIGVKPRQLPAYSGTVDSRVDELSSVKVRIHDINLLLDDEPEAKRRQAQRILMYGNVLITSGDAKYKSCQVYLYSDK